MWDTVELVSHNGVPVRIVRMAESTTDAPNPKRVRVLVGDAVADFTDNELAQFIHACFGALFWMRS